VYVGAPPPPLTVTFETVNVTWPVTWLPFAGLTIPGAVMVTLPPLGPLLAPSSLHPAIVNTADTSTTPKLKLRRC
jgi:hypothetical protein